MTERTSERFTDEDLMAFADGELEHARADLLRQRMATDAVLARRVERFAQTGEALRQRYGDVPRQPPSAGLAALLQRPATRPDGARIPTASGGSIGRRLSPSRALALAASAALVLLAGGYGIGRWHASETSPSAVDMQAAIDDARQRGLETLPNNDLHVVDLPGGGQAQVRPLLTFIDGQGRFCRSYEITLSAGEAQTTASGAACRGEAGDWVPSTTAPPVFTDANNT